MRKPEAGKAHAGTKASTKKKKGHVRNKEKKKTHPNTPKKGGRERKHETQALGKNTAIDLIGGGKKTKEQGKGDPKNI